MWIIKDENELYHYGVLGMKWGEHRFQHPNGRLTEKGKQEFAKVASNPKLAQKHKKRAQKVLKSKVKNENILFKSDKKKAQRHLSKYNQLVTKHHISQDKGKIAAMEKYESKAWKRLAKYYEADRSSKKHRDNALNMFKRYTDIDNNKVKAGRDFIVQRDYYTYPFYIPHTVVGVIGSRKDRIIQDITPPNKYTKKRGK